MKYLVNVADSCGGDEVEYNENYGYMLHQKYNFELINLWKPGTSNEGIIRVTVDWLLENQDKLNNTLFLIGFTSPVRKEWSINLSNFPNATPDLFGKQGNKTVVHQSKRTGERGDTSYIYVDSLIGAPPLCSKSMEKEYILKFLNSNSDYSKFIRRVFLLQSLFTLYGAKFLFYSIFETSIINFEDYSYIDKDNWILPESSFDGYLNKFPKKRVRVISKHTNMQGKHPNKNGHEMWFKIISEKIETRINGWRR